MAHNARAVTAPDARCARVYQAVVENYKALQYRLSPAGSMPSPELTKLLALKPTQCDSARDAKAALSVMNDGISHHSGKIGLILPLTGRYRAVSEAVIAGIRSQFARSPQAFDELVLVRDSHGSEAEVTKVLADLVIKHSVALVIGGVTRMEATILGAWAERLMVPTFLLSPFAGGREPHNAFHVFPSEEAVAKTLASYMQSRGFKRVAMLYPNRQSAMRLPALLTEELTRFNIDTSVKHAYTQGDYASMEGVAKSLFHVDDPARAPELEALYAQKKAEAQKARMPLNHRMIVLPPVVDVDAVVLLDNFRVVRHLVKIFKFFGVKNLPLVGNQEWRARGLIDPPEPLLKGAVFADVIGSYLALPEGLAVTTDPSSPYLARPQDMALLDYQLVGRHAIGLALKALDDSDPRRRKISARIATMTSPPSRAFPPTRAFDERLSANWPIFLFRVEDYGITPFSVPQKPPK